MICTRTVAAATPSSFTITGDLAFRLARSLHKFTVTVRSHGPTSSSLRNSFKFLYSLEKDS